MISITILALLITFASSIYINFFGSVRNLKAANLVYEEARFTMERITKEIRNGTIDYEEYYNQNLVKELHGASYEYIRNDTYSRSDTYCQYSRQFYGLGPDGEFDTLDDESTGVRAEVDAITEEASPPAIGRLNEAGTEYIPDPIQSDLYLININGDRRSYIKRIERVDSGGTTVGKVGLVKLIGEDYGIDRVNSLDPDLDPSTPDTCSSDPGENDGRIDTWICEEGYTCPDIEINVGDCFDAVAGQDVINNPANPDENSFVDITPASLDIVDLKFIISPMDDPRKAYNTNEVQVQPHVTIKMTARANPRLAAEFQSDRIPDITLESTVSARAYNPIITECNRTQCTGLTTIDCTQNVGVCGVREGTGFDDKPAQQTCINYVWSGCSEERYQEYASDNWTTEDGDIPKHESGYGDDEVYQHKSEFASCEADDISCINYYCNDERDNDCNGYEDEMDFACKSFLCNDGKHDDDVEGEDGCIDVGGLCQDIRPLESEEVSCYDGYDNDCDYDAGIEGTGADQFDSDCIAQICSNGRMDPDGRTLPTSADPPVNYFLRMNFGELAGDPVAYKTKDYLLNAEATDTDEDLNEECIDVGGICAFADPPSLTPPEDMEEIGSCEELTEPDKSACLIRVCSDGYDNDCDGLADELDDDCLSVICTNAKADCDLIWPEYDFDGDPNVSEDYLRNYNPICTGPVEPYDEACLNIGGVCDGYWNSDGETYFDHTLIASENVPGDNSSNEIKTPANTPDLCRDGLDNDCDLGTPDGGIDEDDKDCCPDEDGDGYVGPKLDGTNYCFFDVAGLIDCNDLDSEIYPSADEVCNGATYPAGHPLEYQPIDNNCSELNGETASALDSKDPFCCYDLDGDNFGVEGRHLACTGGLPDCEDGESRIYPNAFESILDAIPVEEQTDDYGCSADHQPCNRCFNEDISDIQDFPLNDNCKFAEITYGEDITTTVPRANHIDWYRDKTLDWYIWYAGEESFNPDGLTTGGIAGAYKLRLFEPDCCPSGLVTEICDDASYSDGGSDENCNGLQGFDDHNCITSNGQNFYDYLGSNQFVSTLENGAKQDLETGVITLELATDVGTATSTTLSDLDLSACANSYQITFITTENLPAGTSIKYQISGDGGTNWCGDADCTGDWIEAGDTKAVTFDSILSPETFGTFVRWRAELEGDGGSEIPSMSGIIISITSCT